MRRRDLLMLAAGAAAAPLAAAAQQQPMPVIGFLGGSTPENAAFTLAAFREGLKDTGFVEGRNVAIEYRWAESRYERLPALAADLVVRGVNLIVASGGTPAALAAKGATSVVPVVFITDDP